MPMIETALVASPRRANPGPVTTGVTPVTSGMRSTSARTFCHWSTERSCCERGWTWAATASESSSRKGSRDLVGREDLDRRLEVERAADDVRLQSGEQRRHEDDDAAAQRDARRR